MYKIYKVMLSEGLVHAITQPLDLESLLIQNILRSSIIDFQIESKKTLNLTALGTLLIKSHKLCKPGLLYETTCARSNQVQIVMTIS